MVTKSTQSKVKASKLHKLKIKWHKLERRKKHIVIFGVFSTVGLILVTAEIIHVTQEAKEFTLLVSAGIISQLLVEV